MMAYNERVDVFSFGLTLLEIILGDCTYIKHRFRGSGCVVRQAKGGLGWRPPVPDVLAESQPDLVQLFRDCVLDDMNARPTFVDINTRLEACESSAALLEEEALLPQIQSSHGNIEFSPYLNIH